MQYWFFISQMLLHYFFLLDHFASREISEIIHQLDLEWKELKVIIFFSLVFSFKFMYPRIEALLWITFILLKYRLLFVISSLM